METILVSVLGDAVLDVVVTPREPMRHGADVPATVRIEPGGQGANLAVRLARRRARVRLACALGDDLAGRVLRERLAAEGVDVASVPTASTGSVVVVVDGDGSRSMLSERAVFGASVVPTALADDAAWLVISGYVLLEAEPLDGANDLAARRAVVGCALQDGQAASWSAAVSGVRPDLVILNADETAAIVPRLTQREAAATLARRWSSIVAVTGPAAVVVADGEEILERPVIAAPTVDSTGAGDAYAAVLIRTIADGTWPPGRAALERAMAGAADAAAAVAGTLGAQASIPGERAVPAR